MVKTSRFIRRAFTLVELLVVIGIIAVLVAILLPALSAAQRQAKTIACGANLRSISQALQMYIQDNHGYYPYAGFNTGLGGTPNNFHWANTLASYLYKTNTIEAYSPATNSKMKLFLCPSRKLDTDNLSQPVSTYTAHPLVFGGFQLGWLGSVALGHPLYNLNLIPTSPNKFLFIYKAAWLRDSSTKIIVMDGAQRTDDTFGTAGTVPPYAAYMMSNSAGDRVFQKTGFMDNGNHWFFVAKTYPDVTAYVVKRNQDDNNNTLGTTRDTDFMGGYASYRHGAVNQCNMLYADGHVQVSTMNKSTFSTDLSLRNFHVYFPVVN